MRLDSPWDDSGEKGTNVLLLGANAGTRKAPGRKRFYVGSSSWVIRRAVPGVGLSERLIRAQSISLWAA